MRILIAEDDAILADGIGRALRQGGYAIDRVGNGADADRALAESVHDLLILDLGLPEMDGYTVLRRLRERDSRIPVLILTARDTVGDRVHGLDLGADDYLTKPFDLPELEARVRALLRRGQCGTPTTLMVGELQYDTVGHRVSIGDQPIDLSARELGVLEILLLRAGRLVNKEQMVERLCDWGEEVGINAIEVYVHRLRKKLEPSGISIRTVRGLGYLLDKPREG